LRGKQRKGVKDCVYKMKKKRRRDCGERKKDEWIFRKKNMRG